MFQWVPGLQAISSYRRRWRTLSARLERYDVTAPIIFVLAGAQLTQGPLTPLGFTPSLSR